MKIDEWVRILIPALVALAGGAGATYGISSVPAKEQAAVSEAGWVAALTAKDALVAELEEQVEKSEKRLERSRKWYKTAHACMDQCPMFDAENVDFSKLAGGH